MYNTIKQTHTYIRPQTQIIVLFALFAMVACVLANDYYQPHYETEEKKFISLPALKLKLGTDKLMFKIPNLETLFQSHKEYRPHYPSY